MKTRYPLTLNLGLVVLALIIINITRTHTPVETIDQDYITSPQLIALDSIAESLQADGWSADASYIIAGFETDLYDPAIDTAEYRLYQAYMED